MRKRPVSIAILLLVLGFVLLYYTMQKQYMEFQNTCNQKMEELRNTALLWESNGLLEDSFVSGTFCAESGMFFRILSIPFSAGMAFNWKGR